MRKKKKSSKTKAPNLIRAVISCHRDGYGFAIDLDNKMEDIFLPPHTLKDVYDRDIALVKVKRDRFGRKEGEVVKILERGVKKVVGAIYKIRDNFYVRPHDLKMFWPVLLERKKHSLSYDVGDYAVVKITQYPQNGIARGIVTEILENDDYNIEINNLIAKTGIEKEYPERAVKEALSAIEKVLQKENVKRKDLTRLNFVTIDGERAKDFDDAVYVKKNKDGYKLYVAIADVSAFVTEDGYLDREALFRGNSYYFPDRVFAMLPFELSNEECSLKPNSVRLAFVVEITYNLKGEKLKDNFYLAKIKSKARLTYEEVEEFFCGKGGIDEEIGKMLFLMRELTELLYSHRYEKGTIDFDFPEPEIIIGLKGRIENIIKAQRLSSHRIIEEFMIAANIAVAEWFQRNDIPTIYRIHESPDHEKIRNLRQFLRPLGVDLKENPQPKDIQRIIQCFKNSPYERVVSTLTLRSMKQAKYSPFNSGHYGLALENYLHFTSPIRRYADLVVHRILKNSLIFGRKIKNLDKFVERLSEISLHISKRERLALEMEREIFNFSCAKLMSEMIGEEFKGVISSVTPQGLYVELLDYFVEGFVPVEYLKDDYYRYDERSFSLVGNKKKRRFTIGKEVNVIVFNVHLPTKRIEFKIL